MAITQITPNADPRASGVMQVELIEDPTYPGVVQAQINFDPLTPGILQANINFDPSTPGLVKVILTSSNVAALPPSVPPVNTALPVITGTAQVGQTLTTTNGTWTNSPTSFTYQWNRAGTPIAGATASTYVPVVGDIGSTLTASVVAINGAGSSTAATSAPTSAVVAAGTNPILQLVLDMSLAFPLAA